MDAKIYEKIVEMKNKALEQENKYWDAMKLFEGDNQVVPILERGFSKYIEVRLQLEKVLELFKEEQRGDAENDF